MRLILKKVFKDSYKGKKSEGDIDKMMKSMNPDIVNSLKKMIIETNKQDPKRFTFKRIKARFIPLDNMYQFSSPSTEFWPYGQSFIDPLVLQGKLYILAQLSNIIMKLSRAAPIRKWVIDIGPLQNQMKYVQQLKRELYNQRVTLDDLLSFKSAPKILSDFKDIFTFRKAGVSHLDMEVQALGDTAVKVADLEDSRKELIALSGIPAPYLGYGDVVELQSQLVHINLAFATEISDSQEVVTKQLNKLIDSIADMIGFEIKPSDFMEVTLIPPTVLILQLIEMTAGASQNIIGVFQSLQLPIDPISFLKKYVPFLDWDQLQKDAEKYALQKNTELEMTAKSDAKLQFDIGQISQGGIPQ